MTSMFAPSTITEQLNEETSIFLSADNNSSYFICHVEKNDLEQYRSAKIAWKIFYSVSELFNTKFVSHGHVKKFYKKNIMVFILLFELGFHHFILHSTDD